MKPLNKLIKDLKEIRENHPDEGDITKVINLIVNYENENQVWGLDGFTYTFVSMDQILENVACMAYKWDFWGCQNALEGLEKADWYKETSCGYENLENSDVEERLDEIIDQAKNFKKDAK